MTPPVQLSRRGVDDLEGRSGSRPIHRGVSDFSGLMVESIGATKLMLKRDASKPESRERMDAAS